jgi:hypothetical protein
MVASGRVRRTGLPVTGRGPGAAQNRIRWKTLLARADAALSDIAEPAEVDAVLAAVRDITPAHVFGGSESD